MAESKRDARGWTCMHCTFQNFTALPLCEMCKLARKTLWRCNCGKTNENVVQCVQCLKWNDDLAAEKPKWMRNPDDSWNCMKCTILNAPRASKCSVCQCDSNEMQLDELKHAINWVVEHKYLLDDEKYQGKTTSQGKYCMDCGEKTLDNYCTACAMKRYYETELKLNTCQNAGCCRKTITKICTTCELNAQPFLHNCANIACWRKTLNKYCEICQVDWN